MSFYHNFVTANIKFELGLGAICTTDIVTADHA